jgi:hypothetical protein
LPKVSLVGNPKASLPAACEAALPAAMNLTMKYYSKPNDYLEKKRKALIIWAYYYSTLKV